MKSIKVAQNLSGKRVILRVDWNVPMDGSKVADDFRIKESLPTIEFLRNAGAKIVLLSHREKPTDSLKPVFNYAKDLIEDLTFEVDGPVMLLENVRNDPGEKDNSDEYAKKLSSHGEIFVNEAFSGSHREHASIVGIPKYLPSFAGLRFEREVAELSKAFYPKHPFLFILGGAKFETKLPILERFLQLADTIFVGGALAHNFFKEMGKDIGNSLVSEGNFGLEKLVATGRIVLPEDYITINNKILDAGAQTMENLREKVNSAKLILWNGPLGNYENGYKVATLKLAELIAESGNEAIVGGGDTLAAIQELNLFDKFSFVSTGGGAMLDFLAYGTLPGIKALEQGLS